MLHIMKSSHGFHEWLEELALLLHGSTLRCLGPCIFVLLGFTYMKSVDPSLRCGDR